MLVGQIRRWNFNNNKESLSEHEEDWFVLVQKISTPYGTDIYRIRYLTKKTCKLYEYKFLLDFSLDSSYV